MYRSRLSLRFARPWFFLLALTLLGGLALASGATAEEERDLVLILDASGSMWGQIDGTAKISIAREVMAELAGKLPDDAQVGLVAYGHRKEGDCSDVETVLPIGPLDRAGLTKTVQGLNPKGKTPITRALESAIDLVAARPGSATVILISDGLETCNGDPCATVRKAREAGAELVLHVVGFAVDGAEDGNLSQLECTAQAGGGLYFDARNGQELAAALDRAVEAPPEEGGEKLLIGARAEATATDALVTILAAGSDEEVAHGRTYTGAETNPRVFLLPPGTYDARVRAVSISGTPEARFTGLQVKAGETTERIADFSQGELAVGITRNGELSDATVNIYRAGTRDRVAGGRTYTRQSSNPAVYSLSAGRYDVVVGSVEIEGKPELGWNGVEVKGSERTELAHNFASGTLTVKVSAGEELVDAVVRVNDTGNSKNIAGSRTYVSPKSNPTRFVLPPGEYTVTVQAVKLDGKPRRELSVTVEAEGVVEKAVDLENGV